MRFLLTILFSCILSTSWAAAVDPVIQDDPNYIAVINDDLRKLNDQVIRIGSSTDASNITGILATANGGTGQDFSAIAKNSLPYFSAIGTMGTIGIGTTGTFLISNGPTTAPSWTVAPNLIHTVAFWWGSIDGNYPTFGACTCATVICPAPACGVTPGTTNLGLGTYGGSNIGSTSSGNYLFLTVPEGTIAYTDVYVSKWIKATEVSILGYYFNFWLGTSGGGGGGRSGSAKVIIGGVASSVCTSMSTAPAVCSGTIDVSSLTNGNIYDVELQLKDDAGGGSNTNPEAAKFVVFY